MRSGLHFDQVLLVDDGSPLLPDWPDTQVVTDRLEYVIEKKILLYHFSERLGRPAATNFPGWHRSFVFGSTFARLHGFTKIIHLESDAYLISAAIISHFNQIEEGWSAPWCSRHTRPETAIQVVAGESLNAFHDWAAVDYGELAGTNHENAFPFTRILREFNGDRFGEFLSFVPADADWVTQTRWRDPWPQYFWWLKESDSKSSAHGEQPQKVKPAMAARARSLDSLGRQFQTDKSSLCHDYLEFYDEFLKDWRDAQSVRVLELGVGSGASLKMWEAYFEAGLVIGIDKNAQCRALATGRVRIDILDQEDIAGLMRVALNYGPFHLVVDDGSHMWEHQVLALRSLFPLLKSRGVYILEGIDSSYGRYAETHRGMAEISAADYLKRFLDNLVADSAIDTAAEADSFLRTCPRDTEFIAFRRGTCLIKRRAN